MKTKSTHVGINQVIGMYSYVGTGHVGILNPTGQRMYGLTQKFKNKKSKNWGTSMFSVFFNQFFYFWFISVLFLTMYFFFVFVFFVFIFPVGMFFWFLCLIVFFFVCFRFLLQQTFSAEAGVIMLTCLDPCAWKCSLDRRTKNDWHCLWINLGHWSVF